MNAYSSDLFCEAFRIAYFPNKEVENTLFEVADRLWRLPAINSTQAVVRNSFVSHNIDFYEPVERQPNLEQTEIKKINWIPHVSHGLVSTTEWFDRQLEQIYEPAPTILWHNFKSWDEYVQDKGANRSKVLANSRRRRKNLEKEIGALTFVFDDPRPDVMETCMRWKSQQHRKSGSMDVFSHAQHVRLFQELAKNKLLLVSSLSAGNRLLAVHLGMFSFGRVYSWIPAYDSAYSRYAPGKLLLLSLLEESFNRHHQEFDFLIGGESYKWDYATHTRLISDIGFPPLTAKIDRFIESNKQLILTRFPQLKGSLKKIRQGTYFNSLRK
jgi:Acetyltransferase (GNAT) domain